MPGKQSKSDDPLVIRFKVHPTERQRFPNVVACAGCGCCCCCCCLHSLGSLVGAAVAGGTVGIVSKPRTGAYVYFVMLIAALFVIGVGSLVVGGPGGLLVFALGMPAIQIGVSILSAIMVGFMKGIDRAKALRQIGVITLSSLAGTVIGGLIVFGILMVLK